jgi:integrase
VSHQGCGGLRTKHHPTIASLDELTIMVASVPPRYKLMLLLAAWCGLRSGELTELRRADVADGGCVSGGLVRCEGAFVAGDPKTKASRRVVSLPPHLVPVLANHLAAQVGAAPDALLFPAVSGKHMAPSTLCKVWYPARKKAERVDFHFHDLRHTGATLAAQTGATLADLMRA